LSLLSESNRFGKVDIDFFKETTLKMSQEAVPDWLRNDAKGDAEPLNTMESRSEVLEAPKNREGKAKLIFWFRKFVTMGLCLLMASTALIGLSKLTT
jgi:hypothetical protein